MTAARRLTVVAATGTELLYCDLAHTGPHVWPDQTVVTAGAGAPPEGAERRS